MAWNLKQTKHRGLISLRQNQRIESSRKRADCQCFRTFFSFVDASNHFMVAVNRLSMFSMFCWVPFDSIWLILICVFLFDSRVVDREKLTEFNNIFFKSRMRFCIPVSHHVWIYLWIIHNLKLWPKREDEATTKLSESTQKVMLWAVRKIWRNSITHSLEGWLYKSCLWMRNLRHTLLSVLRWGKEKRDARDSIAPNTKRVISSIALRAHSIDSTSRIVVKCDLKPVRETVKAKKCTDEVSSWRNIIH